MKKFSLLVFLIPIFFSCKKENDFKDFKNKIAGSWELKENLCGECMTPMTIFPEGNGNTIVLSAEGVYERKKQDTVLFKGSYSLKERKDCFVRSINITFSTTENPDNSGEYINLENDELTFSTPNCFADGSINIYRRVQ